MSIRDELWEAAVDQYGYVSSGDATRLGVPVVELGKLAARGGLQRVAYGLYRFEAWPASDRDHLMEAVLWTRDPTAVLSHDTALDVLGLCDVNPDRTHVTVPVQRALRRTNQPATVVVHYEDLADDERAWWEAIPTVTAPTAIRQGIDAGLRPGLIKQALDTAIGRGLLGIDDGQALRNRLDERQLP
jgi:predicted transcriptional regulator of viral defense system